MHVLQWVSVVLVLCCLGLFLRVNLPCRGEGSRTELSVAGGGTESESCQCRASWEGSPSQS